MKFCLCGAQAGFPHEPSCPFPYFANDPRMVHKWLAERAMSGFTTFEVKCYRNADCKEVMIYVSLRATGKRVEGKYQVQYLLSSEGNLIDGGDQFYPSPSTYPVSIESAVYLVGFFDEYVTESSL